VYIAHQSPQGENSRIRQTEAQALWNKIKRLHQQVWDAQ